MEPDPAPGGDAASHPPPASHLLSVATGPRFARGIRSARLELDVAQRAAVETLSRPVRHGFYLWGGVGRGKTLLAERYVQAAPTRRVRRFHFHSFFRALQGEIFEGGGVPGALARIMGSARVVLFDEFHVHDIADGIYLTTALHWMRDHDVLLVATSNYAPAELLPDPAARDGARPATETIETSLEVVGLGEGRDYRREPPVRPLPARFVAPRARGFREGSWTVGPPSGEEGATGLDVDGIPLRAVSAAGEEIVVAFAELCERPTSAAQYLWLAASFRSVVVTAMPDPATLGPEAAARFASLVDVLFDRGTALRVMAAGRPERLLAASDPPRDAARTMSRLVTIPVIEGG
ncbi:MAG: cell division protein ZapE [Microbacterium sp.]|uniref:cell division protein ZapE n=1 Tax=Microbacterium sp. TaxID=51671 RepID=UPI0039E4C10A